MANRATVSPVALAVLALLREGPMHPYQMAVELRTRGRADSVKLSPGALYYAVDALERRGLIRRQATERNGHRPERTVYVSTECGQQELRHSLGTTLRNSETDLSRFAGALGWLDLLDPAEAVDALRERAGKLQKRLAADLNGDGEISPDTLDREYRAHMIRAERHWVTKLARRMQNRDRPLTGKS